MTVENVQRTSQISETCREKVSHSEPPSASGARQKPSDIRPFRPPRVEATSAPSASAINHQPPGTRINQRIQAEVDDCSDTEDEEYVPESDEMASFDDHIDNLFANHDAEQQDKEDKRKDTDFWEVDVIEDGVVRPMNLSVYETQSIPPGRKIVLKFNDVHQAVSNGGGLLSGFLGGLGANFDKFPICMESWHKMKSYKDTVYNDVIKRTFQFEEDPRGQIKKNMLKRLGKCWRDTRSNLFHRFYDDTKSIEENVKNHRPRGIDAEHWRFFLMYRLKEETQEKCRKNAESRAKQQYTHTGGSMTLARRREKEERKHGKKVSRGEVWSKVHKRKDGSYIHEDARTIVEAIQEIESRDEYSKELSQNDSLAQVLGKERPGRVRGVGLGPCPTQIIHGTQQTCATADVDVDKYKREIVELKAEAAEEKRRRQAIENIVRYLLQQQGDNLPANIVAEMDSLGSGPSVDANQDLQRNP